MKPRPNLLITAFFILAALLRLYDLTDEPLETHPTRQIRSATIARAFYFQDNPAIPPSQAEFAAKQLKTVGLIEPPILEFLTSQVYKLIGQELVWLGRLFPILFWLLGGLALYQLALSIGSYPGALTAAAYYLFLPFGLLLSRATMPDPIMVAASVIALWALYAWEKHRTLKYALLPGLFTGFAILTKSVAVIILIFPFAFFILAANDLKAALKDKQVWLIALLAALPTAAYYYYGLFIDGRLGTQFGGRFFPSLWLDLIFYKVWGLHVIRQFNIIAFFAGLAGIWLAKTKPVRWMLLGWWLGFTLYAFTFPYHIMTHDYYHLPLIPIIALSLSPTVTSIYDYFQHQKNRKQVNIFGLVLLAVFLAYTANTHVKLVNTVDYRQQKQVIEEIAGILSHAPEGQIVALTADYETTLKFYGLFNAAHWPGTGDFTYQQLQGGTADDFQDLWTRFEDYRYFLIIDFKEFTRQPNLQTQLSQYPILAKGEIGKFKYLIYNLDRYSN